MTTDWKPENPCSECDCYLVNAKVYTCDRKCPGLDKYQSAITAQKKLLEYQKAHPDTLVIPEYDYSEGRTIRSKFNVILTETIESMLKQLEDK